MPKTMSFYTDIAYLDITNKIAVVKFLESNQTDIVVNCATCTNANKAEEETEMGDRIYHLAIRELV